MGFAGSLNALNQVGNLSCGKRIGLAIEAGLPEIQVESPREVEVAQIGLEHGQGFKAIQGLVKWGLQDS